MKPYLMPAGLLVALLAAGVSLAADAVAPNPYAMSRATGALVVHFSIEQSARHPGRAGVKTPGKAISGTETLYLEGDRYSKVLRMAPAGDAAPRETVEIVTPQDVYRLDMTARTGTKIDNPKQYGRRAYEKLSAAERNAFHERLAHIGGGTIDLLGVGAKAGTEKLLGRICDVYEYGERPVPAGDGAQASDQNAVRVKTWIWRETGIPLRVRMEAAGWVREVRATGIERDATIDASRFTVPAGVSVIEDQAASETAKRYLLGDFERLRTGKPQVVRIKAEPVPRSQANAREQP